MCSQPLSYDMEKLRISALTKAAALSNVVKEVTLGPNCSRLKYENLHIKSEHGTNVRQCNTSKTKPEQVQMSPKEERLIKRIQSLEATKVQKTEETFSQLLENMLKKRAEFMESFWKKQSEECEKKTLEIKNRKLKLLKEIDSSNLLVSNGEVYTESKTIQCMNQIFVEQSKAAIRFATLTSNQTLIYEIYTQIMTILTCEDDAAQKLHEKYSKNVEKVIKTLNNIMEGSEDGIITDKDVCECEELHKKIDLLRSNIVSELQLLKLEHSRKLEENKKQENELQRLEAEKTKAKEEAVTSQFFSKTNYIHFVEIENFLDSYEAKSKELCQDPKMKKFRFDCQKAVNTPINAVSSVSGSHIKDKFEKLSKLLRGERVNILDMSICASDHPQGVSYCMSLLAKKIVRQGDLLVSSNPEAAFPLASLVVTLCNLFPDLSKLVEANFYKECPYLVPMILPKYEGQSDQDFYKSRGYVYVDGIVEKQDKFLKRNSGVFRLQCAIWIATSSKTVNQPNPWGLKCAWKWIAAFINLKPESDICSTLLYDFFTVCGAECIKNYRLQFFKIIKIVYEDYMSILATIDEGGPKTRLEVFLEDVLKTRSIPPPKGIIEPNKW